MISLLLLLSIIITIICTTVTEAMIIRIPLPGGRGISINPDTGVIRIKLASDAERKVDVPPMGTRPSDQIIDSIVVKDTGTIKGFGAFSRAEIPCDSFLGFYEGQVLTSREELDAKIAERKSAMEEVSNAMDYVMALDGGVTFLDGYDRALDRSKFSPVHFNHADKGTKECNIIRLLEDDRVAFFTSRVILKGEELCFDYGRNFWKGREANKI